MLYPSPRDRPGTARRSRSRRDLVPRSRRRLGARGRRASPPPRALQPRIERLRKRDCRSVSSPSKPNLVHRDKLACRRELRSVGVRPANKRKELFVIGLRGGLVAELLRRLRGAEKATEAVRL